MGKCRGCNRPVPEGVDYCRDCAERHFSTETEKTEQVDRKKPENIQDSQQKNGFTDDLRDGAFQGGIMWRKNKIQAIHKARQVGVSDEHILRELRIGGITIQKARELMKDSEELLGK